MARQSLAEIRAELKKEAARDEGGFVGDNALYPFWMIPTNKNAVVRFIPDKNKDNPKGFYLERLMINLAFSGIKGDANSKPVTVKVPCVEMYGMECPVQAEIKPWYDKPELEDTANKYWKKRSYLYQGFVVEHPGFVDKNGKPIERDEPENPIRRLVLNPSLQKKIKSLLMRDDLEYFPDDPDRGREFTIRKTQDGKWASYDESSWGLSEKPLTDVQREALEKYEGGFSLIDYLPNKPSEAELKIIFEMFEASVDDKPYDPDKWGSYYTPFGMKRKGDDKDEKKSEESAPKSESSDDSGESQVSEEEAAPEEEEAPEKDEEAPSKSSSDRAASILDRIRKDQGKS